jgi:hypothetical protein
MAEAADIQWVKLRLPLNASFNRNGVEVSLDEIVAQALDEHLDRSEALADLLDILAADEKYDAETICDYSYSGHRLGRKAEKLRGAGSLSFVPIRFKPVAGESDENAG